MKESVLAERFIRTLKTKIHKYMTAISKNIYFDALENIVNKYNNTIHRTIKMKTRIIKILSLNLVIMQEFLSTKIFLLKDIFQNNQKKLLLLIKLKIQFRGLMLLVI